MESQYQNADDLIREKRTEGLVPFSPLAAKSLVAAGILVAVIATRTRYLEILNLWRGLLSQKLEPAYVYRLAEESFEMLAITASIVILAGLLSWGLQTRFLIFFGGLRFDFGRLLPSGRSKLDRSVQAAHSHSKNSRPFSALPVAKTVLWMIIGILTIPITTFLLLAALLVLPREGRLLLDLPLYDSLWNAIVVTVILILTIGAASYFVARLRFIIEHSNARNRRHV